MTDREAAWNPAPGDLCSCGRPSTHFRGNAKTGVSEVLCDECFNAKEAERREREAKREEVLRVFFAEQNADVIAGSLVGAAVNLQIGRDETVPNAARAMDLAEKVYVARAYFNRDWPEVERLEGEGS